MQDTIITKYMTFQRTESRGSTLVYHVKNLHGNFLLGVIKWYPPFRKYSFFPEEGMVFDARCLNEIVKVITDLNEFHAAELKFRKSRMS